MLLIDGVKYELWNPSTEDDFEQVVKEHTQEIFGQQSIYLDRKQKLKSLSGIASIPDGYIIGFGDSPQWHIVEMELSSHPLHDHIVSQVSRFITGIGNPNIQRTIVNSMDEEIARDDFLRLKFRKAIEPTETHRFLSDLISRPPVLSIIIEKDTKELREALRTLNHPQIRVIEFQTFKRVGAETIHAHLFEPIYQMVVSKVTSRAERCSATTILSQNTVYHIEDILSYITDLDIRTNVSSTVEEIKGWKTGRISVDATKNALSMKVDGRVFAYLAPRRKYFVIATYNAENIWSDYPIHGKGDLDNVLAVTKTAMERKAKGA